MIWFSGAFGSLPRSAPGGSVSEVWLDGMEISQFTYFQQVGGFDCRPVSAELTYGTERIAMYLQGIDNVYDLEWTKDIKYGDVHHQSEVEWSVYNFETADIGELRKRFDMYEAEGIRTAEKGLVLPTYGPFWGLFPYLRSKTPRGATCSVSANQLHRTGPEPCLLERENYLRQRETMGTPAEQTTNHLGCRKPAPPNRISRWENMMGKELLLEIGTEEIPAAFLPPKALRDMEGIIRKELAEGRILHGEIRTMGTPRRRPP